jgi:hypothetical protein
MISIRITREQAADALRNAATVAGDSTIHGMCFTARGEIVTKRYAVEDVIDEWHYAKMFAFEPGPFGHHLAVLMNGLIFRYDVPMPDADAIPDPQVAAARPDMKARMAVRKRLLLALEGDWTDVQATYLINEIRAEHGLGPVVFPQWVLDAHAMVQKGQVPSSPRSRAKDRFVTAFMFIALGMTKEDGR